MLTVVRGPLRGPISRIVEIVNGALVIAGVDFQLSNGCEAFHAARDQLSVGLPFSTAVTTFFNVPDSARFLSGAAAFGSFLVLLRALRRPMGSRANPAPVPRWLAVLTLSILTLASTFSVLTIPFFARFSGCGFFALLGELVGLPPLLHFLELLLGMVIGTVRRRVSDDLPAVRAKPAGLCSSFGHCTLTPRPFG